MGWHHTGAELPSRPGDASPHRHGVADSLCYRSANVRVAPRAWQAEAVGLALALPAKATHRQGARGCQPCH